MKIQATPRPWKFNTNKTALLVLNNKNEHKIILDIEKRIEPSSADAKYIIKAINLHDELASELSITLEVMESVMPDALKNRIKDLLKRAKDEG